jgi:hypothetical protein
MENTSEGNKYNKLSMREYIRQGVSRWEITPETAESMIIDIENQECVQSQMRGNTVNG